MYINEKVIRKNKVKSILQLIFGGLNSLLFGSVSIAAVMGDPDLKEYTVLYILLAVPWFFMLYRGIKNRKNQKMALMIGSIFNDSQSDFISMEELGKRTGKNADEMTVLFHNLKGKGFLEQCRHAGGSVSGVLLEGKNPSMIPVICPNCGGQTMLPGGRNGKCSYCGSPI